MGSRWATAGRGARSNLFIFILFVFILCILILDFILIIILIYILFVYIIITNLFISQLNKNNRPINYITILLLVSILSAELLIGILGGN